MRKRLSFYAVLSVAMFGICFGSIVLADVESNVDANQALQLLLDGNKRFIAGNMVNYKHADAKMRKSLVSGQKPYVAILSCSDSRVSPEIIFDQGLGEVFVIRVAGNVTNPAVLGSIEYAAEHLGTPLIMVLGHTNCGAVIAAIDTHGKFSRNLKSIIRRIAPAVKKAEREYGTKNREKLIEGAIDENIQLVATKLTKQSWVIKNLVHEGKVKIITAKYDLDSGEVKVMEPMLAKEQ